MIAKRVAAVEWIDATESESGERETAITVYGTIPVAVSGDVIVYMTEHEFIKLNQPLVEIE